MTQETCKETSVPLVLQVGQEGSGHSQHKYPVFSVHNLAVMWHNEGRHCAPCGKWSLWPPDIKQKYVGIKLNNCRMDLLCKQPVKWAYSWNKSFLLSSNYWPLEWNCNLLQILWANFNCPCMFGEHIVLYPNLHIQVFLLQILGIFFFLFKTIRKMDTCKNIRRWKSTLLVILSWMTGRCWFQLFVAGWGQGWNHKITYGLFLDPNSFERCTQTTLSWAI